MPDATRLAADIEQLNALERRFVERFVYRKRAAPAPGEESVSFGDRIADRVTALGGSWSFIFLTIAAIGIWMFANASMGRPFDPFPYILLNLVLACMTVLQAPLIMMSQNRQADRDRSEAKHDYEVNTKAEMEIVGLHAKFDEIRDVRWLELMRAQDEQIALLTQLLARQKAAGA